MGVSKERSSELTRQGTDGNWTPKRVRVVVVVIQRVWDPEISASDPSDNEMAI